MKRLRESVRASWLEIKEMHRGLPNPENYKGLSWELIVRSIGQGSRDYMQSVRNDVHRVQEYRRRSREAAELRKEEERNEERHMNEMAQQAARDTADTARSMADEGPRMVQRWLRPRVRLWTRSLQQFAVGYKEGVKTQEHVWQRTMEALKKKD